MRRGRPMRARHRWTGRIPRDRSRDTQREGAEQKRQSSADFRAVHTADKGFGSRASAHPTVAEPATVNPKLSASSTDDQGSRPPDVEQGEGAEIFPPKAIRVRRRAAKFSRASLRLPTATPRELFSIATTYAKPGEKLQILA